MDGAIPVAGATIGPPCAVTKKAGCWFNQDTNNVSRDWSGLEVRLLNGRSFRFGSFFDVRACQLNASHREKNGSTGVRASIGWKRSSQPFRDSARRANRCARNRDSPIHLPTRSAYGDSLQPTSQLPVPSTCSRRILRCALTTCLFMELSCLERLTSICYLRLSSLLRTPLAWVFQIQRHSRLDEKFFRPVVSDTQFGDIYSAPEFREFDLNGVSFTLNRRMSDELAFSASYTLSKTFDDASDFDEQPQSPFRSSRGECSIPPASAATLCFQRAVGVAYRDEEERGGMSEQNTGWLTQAFSHIEVAPILTLGSGRPVNPLTGLDSNQSHAFPISARPLGLGKKFSEDACAGHDGLPRPEVFPVRRGETPRRGGGILQPVQRRERLPDQCSLRLRLGANTRI